MRNLILAKVCVVLSVSSAVADPAPAVTDVASPQAIPAPVAEELRRIQRDMGGPVVDQFPSLKEEPTRTNDARSKIDVPMRHMVESLRTAATQLDDIANRLERLELYRQADSLREQAQRLRLDARRLAGGGSEAPQWGEGVQPSGTAPFAPPALEPRPMEPQAQPVEPQTIEPRPLEPVPSPE
jgi:hypothetical protein